MNKSFSKFSFLKIPKHKKFEFTPRHYDEQKERLEKRKEEIAQELNLNTSDEKSRREINFRAKVEHADFAGTRSRANKRSNLRLIAILGILIYICYQIYINLETILGAVTK